MGRDRVVDPEPIRIPISDGDFIDVKKRLNHGEHEDYLARLSPHYTPGEPMRMDTRQVRTGKVLAYLLGWSLTHKGKPLPMSIDMLETDRLSVLNSLDKETFNEIHDAIETHEDKVEKEAKAAKNGQGGATESPAISPSPELQAGATSGSETLTGTSTAS